MSVKKRNSSCLIQKKSFESVTMKDTQDSKTFVLQFLVRFFSLFFVYLLMS